MPEEPRRSRAARRAAERALVRVVHHYGACPDFVVLGGLVPELLCASATAQHAGTVDVDVQVDLEIAHGSNGARRLELALRNAEFAPDGETVWRWIEITPAGRVVVKFELLADLDDAPAEAIASFDGCDHLGAVNLRGTGFASRDFEPHVIKTWVGGVEQVARVSVAGLAGFLLAKIAAARARRKPKDWYDIAFVLIHNDSGGPRAAAQAVLEKFRDELRTVRTALDDLLANFGRADAQGPRAYVEQMMIDHPELDPVTLAADAVVAVSEFHALLIER